MQKSTIGLMLLAAVIAVLTFFAEPTVFPPVETPPGSLLPAFIFLGVWDAVAFGVGVALVGYILLNYSKWPTNVRMPFLVLFLIAIWSSLLNWIHDGLHQSGAMPPNWGLLAAVEYAFHFPWLLISGILVIVALTLAKAYQTK